MSDYIYTPDAAKILGLGMNDATEKCKRLGLNLIKGPSYGRGNIWLVSKAEVLALKAKRSEKLADAQATTEKRREQAYASGLPMMGQMRKIESRLENIEKALNLLVTEWAGTREAPVSVEIERVQHINGAN